MRSDLLIVGQGLAGTMLAWECERTGIDFAIIDAGHATAASRVAAGLINPITGRRLVKSWRVESWLPVARESYRAFEAALGVRVWHEVRVRRFFREDRERRVFAEKAARGELAPFAEAASNSTGASDGFWIEGAARVDTSLLLATARARWIAAGRLREGRVEWPAARGSHDLVIDCTGAAGLARSEFGFVPFEFSRGEILTLAVDGLAPEVVLNRGHWIAPTGRGEAKAGATHEPGVTEAMPTAAGRAAIETGVTAMIGGNFAVKAHEAGIRVNLPDKHPVAGRHPLDARLGLLGGLGAKGSLTAPALARQWISHLCEGVAFDAEVDVARFWPRHSSQASSL